MKIEYRTYFEDNLLADVGQLFKENYRGRVPRKNTPILITIETSYDEPDICDDTIQKLKKECDELFQQKVELNFEINDLKSEMQRNERHCKTHCYFNGLRDKIQLENDKLESENKTLKKTIELLRNPPIFNVLKNLTEKVKIKPSDIPTIFPDSVDTRHLKIISDMTVELTAIRQKGCNHLSVENFSTNLFQKLVKIFREAFK